MPSPKDSILIYKDHSNASLKLIVSLLYWTVTASIVSLLITRNILPILYKLVVLNFLLCLNYL